ncbi:hypothetical protein FEZ63_08130 [Microvirga brassicacearum]|uniref:Uncharacterized protein n=1 Tax=Microvirga brassicacearum TaxID=2580413 RepID=A0A5N3PDB6_9HYPH|nr:hypothetical protein FEZ63_08130 [Microvirga brassicacearum]
MPSLSSCRKPLSLPAG